MSLFCCLVSLPQRVENLFVMLTDRLVQHCLNLDPLSNTASRQTVYAKLTCTS